jgi:hypothetical protein
MRSSPKHSPYAQLKRKWTHRHRKIKTKLWTKHSDALQWLKGSSQQALFGSLASLIMMTNPVMSSTVAQMLPHTPPPLDKKSIHTTPQLIADLRAQLPSTVQPLNEDQEYGISKTLTDYFHVPAYAVLAGKRLNRSYGIIGAEQHLMRYPGDTMATHFDTTEEQIYTSSGMAPGRGAYGYFANSQGELTEEDKIREKYYIAVPTFLSPGWQEDTNGTYNFFRYRKMLVVNPENGKAIVANISDAGPAEWTGKHLGGSPEVMSYLERRDGGARGPVVYFFIDDLENTVPLGPIIIQP